MPYGPAARDGVPYGYLRRQGSLGQAAPGAADIGYLVIAALLLLIKAIQLGTG